jgi:hypothetical protein
MRANPIKSLFVKLRDALDAHLRLGQAQLRLAQAMQALAEMQAIQSKRQNDLEHALQCLAFAIGKQPGAYPERWQRDFLKCAALFWQPERGQTPTFVQTLLEQHEAGALQLRQEGTGTRNTGRD